jgi:hypothetical protein
MTIFAVNASAASGKPTINVTFIKPDGSAQTVKAPIGDSMLDVAHANDIDIEGEAPEARGLFAYDMPQFVTHMSQWHSAAVILPGSAVFHLVMVCLSCYIVC